MFSTNKTLTNMFKNDAKLVLLVYLRDVITHDIFHQFEPVPFYVILNALHVVCIESEHNVMLLIMHAYQF